MSKRNDKNDGNGDDRGFSDSDLALIHENDWTVDATGNVFDDHGNELPPGTVAAAIVVDEMDIPPGAKRAHGLDAMFAPSVRAEPNTLGQHALPYSEAATPPGPFDRPGTPIDSDGQMGTPAEWQAQMPEPLDAGEGEFGHAGSGVSPPPSALAQAHAEGASLWARLVPSGEVLKADHRESGTGQYATGPTHPLGTPAGPSHEVAQVNLSDNRSTSAFIGSAVAPMPASVPTIRMVPPEETKGATL